MATAAFGNDVSGGLGALGMAGSIYGGLESMGGSKMAYQASQQQAALEQQADAQRLQAMEISARRQQLQNVRVAQQAYSSKVASLYNSGAQFSSSGQAGARQAGAQATYANQGISAQEQIGKNLFGINAQIDEQKMIEAEGQNIEAQGQGISSIFGALGKSAGSIGQLATLLPIGL